MTQSRLQTWIAELKRRRVFRAAGVYAATAFVLLQVVDLAVEPLRLPDWAMTLLWIIALAGFPLVLMLAWVFDITPTEQLSRGTVRPKMAPARRPRALALAVGGVLVVAVAGGWLATTIKWRAGSSESNRFSANVIAVLPFEVRGGNQFGYLAEGMVDLLAAKLGGVQEVRAIDPRALITHVRTIRASIAPVDAQAAARHFSAGYYVVGSVVEIAGRMQVRAALYNSAETEPVVEAAAEGRDEELFSMVDDLAGQLLAGLERGAPGRLTRLAALTTDSISALKLYLAGERAYRDGRYPAAVEAFEGALRIDSMFALAAYRLSTATWWTSDLAKERWASARAQALAGSLGPRERVLLEAFGASRPGPRGIEFARAEQLYRRIVAQYPDDVDAWYQLGEVLYHHGGFLGYTRKDAVEPFARALEISPFQSSAMYHRINLAGLLGDTVTMLALSERLLKSSGDSVFSMADRAYMLKDRGLQRMIERKLSGEVDGINTNYTHIASRYAVADDSAALRIWQLLVDKQTASDVVRATAHGGRARLFESWGRFAHAHAELRAIARYSDHLFWQERVRLAVYPLAPAARQTHVALRDSLLAWQPRATPAVAQPEYAYDFAAEGMRLYLLGVLEARFDTLSARRRAEQLAAIPGEAPEHIAARDFGVLLHAELDARAGHAAVALRRLESARFWSTATNLVDIGTLNFDYAGFLRAELLRELGQTADAARWYQVVIDNMASYREPALYQLCLLNLKGRPEVARAACSRVLSYWRQPDALLREARTRVQQRLLEL